MPETDLPRRLAATAKLEFVRTEREYRITASRQSPSGRLTWVLGKGDACAFCRYMAGKVVWSDDPRIDRLIPAHINCACMWVEIGDREGGEVDWLDWEDGEFRELLETHAHFYASDKYPALRVPAAPSGRDFVFRRGKEGEKGTREWKRPRYEERDDLNETGVAETREPWLSLPEKPGGGGPTGPVERGPSGRGPAGGGPGARGTLRDVVSDAPADDSGQYQAGDNPRQARSRANLEGLRGHLTITETEDPEVQEMLDELSLVPGGLLGHLAAEGLHVYVGRGNVTGLDRNEDLATVRPLGAPAGQTFRQRYGIYRANRREVTIGTGPGSSFSRPAHEIAHAVGDIWGYNSSEELEDHFVRLAGHIPGFSKQYPPSRQRAEFFAEAFAVTLKDEFAARLIFDDQLVDWIAGIIRERS